MFELANFKQQLPASDIIKMKCLDLFSQFHVKKFTFSN